VYPNLRQVILDAAATRSVTIEGEMLLACAAARVGGHDGQQCTRLPFPRTAHDYDDHADVGEGAPAGENAGKEISILFNPSTSRIRCATSTNPTTSSSLTTSYTIFNPIKQKHSPPYVLMPLGSAKNDQNDCFRAPTFGMIRSVLRERVFASWCNGSTATMDCLFRFNPKRQQFDCPVKPRNRFAGFFLR
jgi:hypothetical protein